MRFHHRLVVLSSLLLAAPAFIGCPSPRAGPDSGTAPTTDAGERRDDAGGLAADAGAPASDSGSVGGHDAGDSGVGAVFDAGGEHALDAGTSNPPDAGGIVDAGIVVDAAVVTDAGVVVDAGGIDPADAGHVDAADVDAGVVAWGDVSFVAGYEPSSGWDNTDARVMAESILAEIAALMRTGGAWDAELRVYFKDLNTGFGFTSPVRSDTLEVDGQMLRVTRTWQRVVRGATFPGESSPTEADADFVISINIGDNGTNAGLVRHEVMHGLGAVGIAWPLMSEANVLSGLLPGDGVSADLYATHIVDRDGMPLLGEYDANTEEFEVQNYAVDDTFTAWTDGEAGLFFRGQRDDGSDYDMPLSTFPANGGGAQLRLNEPADLMSASAHPDWNHAGAPDRAFLRTLGYPLRMDD